MRHVILSTAVSLLGCWYCDWSVISYLIAGSFVAGVLWTKFAQFMDEVAGD